MEREQIPIVYLRKLLDWIHRYSNFIARNGIIPLSSIYWTILVLWVVRAFTNQMVTMRHKLYEMIVKYKSEK